MRTRCAHTGGGWLNNWEKQRDARYDEGEKSRADVDACQGTQSTTQVSRTQVTQDGDSKADKPTTLVQAELPLLLL